MPRYVVLEHDHPALHWDLMLETADGLHSWRLPQPPGGADVLTAIRLGEHRLSYLEYEGPVSGGRGQVKRWDAGDFREDVDSTPTMRRLILRGGRVQGSVLLEQIDGMNWRWRWS